jgi:hypothetical protein
VINPSCSEFNPSPPSRAACGHLRVAEPKRPSLCRSEDSAAQIASYYVWRRTRSCHGRSAPCQQSSCSSRPTDPSFQYATAPDRAPSEVAGSACDQSSHSRRFVFGEEVAQLRLSMMQPAILSPPRRQISVLLVAGQPRSRQTAPVIVTTAQGSSPRSFPDT